MFLIHIFRGYLFNIYEFWNHVSKRLHYIVCSSVVVRLLFHIPHVNMSFYCHFVSKAFVTIDFKTEGEFSLHVAVCSCGLAQWNVYLVG